MDYLFSLAGYAPKSKLAPHDKLLGYLNFFLLITAIIYHTLYYISQNKNRGLIKPRFLIYRKLFSDYVFNSPPFTVSSLRHQNDHLIAVLTFEIGHAGG